MLESDGDNNVQPDPVAKRHRLYFFALSAVWQIGMVILYAVFTDYSAIAQARAPNAKEAGAEVDSIYPLYQDVHVMVFVGFGFLMTFLYKYGFSAVGYNFLISGFVIQWSILVNGFMDGAWDDFESNCEPLITDTGKAVNATRFCIEIGMESLVAADFNAAAVLITFGAVLGKTNPLQMIVVSILEIPFLALNENIGVMDFQAVDMGGSIFIHTFGAYFGLALSWVISSNKSVENSGNPHNKTTKSSDLFSMIGTIFLWLFWPSFNGALAPADQQYRVIINTVLALSACCVTAFAVDNLLRPHHKFDMVSIQNATLAGGVAVGTTSDLVILPWGAILIGIVAGTVSVLGYIKIQPWLEHFGLDDTCGVHNLHGMPGVIAAIGGSIAAAAAGESAYGESIGDVFGARAGENGIDAAAQARFQLAALASTLIISIGGGIVTGLIIKHPFFVYKGVKKNGGQARNYHICNFCHSTDETTFYDDAYYWVVPPSDSNE